MTGKPKPHVFLSHVREDAERVERLAADLEARGIETWIDRHKIKPGQRWQRAIEDAIRFGAFFVACFSHASSARTRTYMNEELYIALEEVRLRPAETSWFIPVRLNGCEIPDLPIAPNVTVRSFQWLNMFPDWEMGVERLAEALVSASQTAAVPPAPAVAVPRRADTATTSGAEPLRHGIEVPLAAHWGVETVLSGKRDTPADRIDRARRRPTDTKSADTFGRARLVSINPGTVLRDVDAFWCPEIVIIPRGEFIMGSPEGEEAHESERPQRLVKISYRLAVGRYPITFDEYDYFTEMTGREPPGDDAWGRGRRPVINITWFDAKAYVEWLAFQTGHPYRLLSEAEWEYACRAGTATRYWWGDEITPEHANYGESVGRTSEVGSYRANPWGMYDMHGNVWEWVADRWHDTYHGAPDDGSAWTTGSRSVVQRGGSWQHEPIHLCSTSRTSESPRVRDADSGFRIARTL